MTDPQYNTARKPSMNIYNKHNVDNDHIILYFIKFSAFVQITIKLG